VLDVVSISGEVDAINMGVDRLFHRLNNAKGLS
jgi:hypothetical protein